MDTATLRSLELAKESSDRARAVLLFTQVACIIVFMAAWHEAPFSWTYARLRAVQAASWYLDCAPIPHPEGPEPEAGFKHDNCHFLDKKGNRTEQPFSGDEINQGKALIVQWNMTPAEIRRHLQNMQDSVVSRSMNVSAPLFGFSFDINDLGLIGGLSFAFLLMWLYFSLRREGENVRLLFESPNAEDRNEIYRLASMTQVLTIPPEREVAPTSELRRIPRMIAKVILRSTLWLLYLTPFAAQAFVVWLDRDTWSRAYPYSLTFVSGEYLASCILLAVVAVLTIFCIRCAALTDKRWGRESPEPRKANAEKQPRLVSASRSLRAHRRRRQRRPRA